jgi:hypothetical protein
VLIRLRCGLVLATAAVFEEIAIAKWPHRGLSKVTLSRRARKNAFA